MPENVPEAKESPNWSEDKATENSGEASPLQPIQSPANSAGSPLYKLLNSETHLPVSTPPATTGNLNAKFTGNFGVSSGHERRRSSSSDRPLVVPPIQGMQLSAVVGGAGSSSMSHNYMNTTRTVWTDRSQGPQLTARGSSADDLTPPTTSRGFPVVGTIPKTHSGVTQ